MTFEHVVTCEVCRRRTGVGFRNNEPVLDPPWHTLTIKSAA
jgi:hypothetical protein